MRLRRLLRLIRERKNGFRAALGRDNANQHFIVFSSRGNNNVVRIVAKTSQFGELLPPKTAAKRFRKIIFLINPQ